MSIAEHAGRISDRQSDASKAYVLGPVLDFLMLGGGSVIVMASLWLFLPVSGSAVLASAMLWLANVINHPHFGHSYQIFYRDFRAKAFGSTYSQGLRTRYVIAGIIVPAVLGPLLVGSVLLDMPQILKFAINAMVFLTGWHYVKQGYGIFMLESAIKRRFLNAQEKKILLINAYGVWALAWVLLNRDVVERDVFGIKAYAIPMPDAVMYAVVAIAGITSLLCILALGRRILRGHAIAWNGVVAYVVSVYVWLLIPRLSPLLIFIIPTMHSLQYLVVVWRYQLNRERAEEALHDPDSRIFGMKTGMRPMHARFVSFLAIGAILGFLGFWGVPFLLDILQPYDSSQFGSFAFMAVFWLFINVHHYFLDNVMWRRENTDMKKYLFG